MELHLILDGERESCQILGRTLLGMGFKGSGKVGDFAQKVMALDDQTLTSLAREEAAAGVEDFMERRMDWIVDQEQREAFAARLRGLPGFPGREGNGHES